MAQIGLIWLLEVVQTPLVKDMIRNFLIYVNKKTEEVWMMGQNNLRIHNFSPYSLMKEEVAALSYGYDQDIPNYTDSNTINTNLSCFFKIFSSKNVCLSLNSYHNNIQFTMEIAQNNQILFLDVLLIRNAESNSQWK